MTKVSTHIMFQGDATDAIDLYASIFKDFSILTLERYEDGGGGPAGTIKLATIEFCGLSLVVIDSPIKHSFSFTPSVSIFVDFDSANEQERAFARLSEGGKTLMALENHGFSRRFGWISDRFGVSWQLNLP